MNSGHLSAPGAREAEHQARIVHEVRQILAEWSLHRPSGRGLGDPETALRQIAKRVGYYLATDAPRALIEEFEGTNGWSRDEWSHEDDFDWPTA